MKTVIFFFLALPFLLAAYLFLNIALSAWMLRSLRGSAKDFLNFFGDFWIRQYESISLSTALANFIAQAALITIFVWIIRTPTDIFALPAILIGLTFLISANIVSLVARMPVFLIIWNNSFTKILLLVLPISLHFVAKAIASERLTALMEISASHMPITHVVCTFLFLLLLSGLAFGIASLFFEVLLLVSLAVDLIKKPLFDRPSTHKPRNWFMLMLSSRPVMRSVDRLYMGRVARRMSISLVLLSSFFACYFLMTSSIRVHSGSLERVILYAMVFEFDAIPTKYCRLSQQDEKMARLENPRIKVLPSSTSQEKAFVLRRGETLLEPVTFVDLPLQLPIEKSLSVGDVVNCLIVQEDVGDGTPQSAR